MDENDYSDDMQPLIGKIKQQARKVDIPSSLWGGVAFLFVGFFVSVWPKVSFLRESLTPDFLKWIYNYSSYWQIILAFFAFIAMSGAIKTAEIGRKDILEHLQLSAEERLGMKTEATRTLGVAKPNACDRTKTVPPHSKEAA
jgi:hypothetical protein